jgi:hypothetical protein
MPPIVVQAIKVAAGAALAFIAEELLSEQGKKGQAARHRPQQAKRQKP